MFDALFEGDVATVPQSEVDSKLWCILHSWRSTQAISWIAKPALKWIIMIHEPIIWIHESECIISNSWDCLYLYALLFSHMIWVWRAMCFSIVGFEIPALICLLRYLLSYVRFSICVCPTFIQVSLLRWVSIFPIFSNQSCLPSCKTRGGKISRNSIVCIKLI